VTNPRGSILMAVQRGRIRHGQWVLQKTRGGRSGPKSATEGNWKAKGETISSQRKTNDVNHWGERVISNARLSVPGCSEEREVSQMP